MLFENYSNNLDVNDKYGLNDVDISNSIICSNFNIIKKKKYEEVDKGNPPMAAAILGLNNTAATSTTINSGKLVQTWTDIDAQESYLDGKPTCYLILSKPGAGAYSLGEAISKKFNCVHLCPRNILLDEIEQNSQTGKCVDFNMKHNKVLKSNTVLPILKKKLQSPVIKHRGYVLSGIPMVDSNRNLKYIFTSLYGEESIAAVDELLYDLICNLKKKKPKKPRPESESTSVSVSSAHEGEGELEEEEHEQEEQQDEGEEEEEEQGIQLPKFLLETCADIIHPRKAYMDTKQVVLIHQLNEIFHLEISPDIIFYITCPDVDLTTKKAHKYMNYKNNLNTMDPFASKIENNTKWPIKYSMSDYESPHDNIVFNSKYNCRQPINYTEKSSGQMCNYKCHISTFLNDILQNFHTKHIIKLDGRTSVHQMMHHIKERLLVLPIAKPVIIPEPLYLEDPPEDIEDFWNMVQDLNVIRNGVVNFSRYPSAWFNRCPVELKNRKSVRGKPKFGVTYFKHVFLLSSLNALIAFCRNPRPYLKLHYLEPTCRIIVTGTKSSGKTMISECLSWIFDTPIISYSNILKSEKKKKYETFSKTILSEIIATIEDERYAKWQNIESDRVANLNDWHFSSLKNLKKYIPVLSEYLTLKAKQQSKKENEDVGEESSETEEKKPMVSTQIDQKLWNNFSTMRKKLSFLPFLDDLELCNYALQNKDLLQFAPARLLIVTERPKIPVLGDDDVTKAISAYIEANDLQKEIEPTPEEATNVITDMIKCIDAEAQETSSFEMMYGKYIIDGFPSDSEYWNLLVKYKFLPDNTIALIENREIEPELIEHYVNIETCPKYYQERFLLANDPLMKVKLLTKKPLIKNSALDVQGILHKFVDDTLDYIFPARTVDETEFLTSFSQSIDKFREDWDSVKLNLEEHFKSFIEIELETKSDVELVEEVLLKLRQSYGKQCTPNEDEDFGDQEEEEEAPKDMLTFNHPSFLCETNIYCPIAFYDHGVLWEGKQEFSVKYDNKFHYFSKEDYLELFRKDVNKYQSYNQPHKKLPALRLCVIGCTGSGKTSIAKLIAKELGLFHLDFAAVINDYLMPRHFKKVGFRYENKFNDVPIDEEGVMEFQMGEENENLVTDILSNETEIRRMVYNYLERGTPLMSILMQKIIRQFWFEEPFLSTGIVIDGFPRLPTDVEDMIASVCIPDLIIELESSVEISLDRLSPQLFKLWKTQQNEAKAKAKKKLDEINEKWMHFVTKKVVTKVVCDDIIQNALSSIEDEQPTLVASTESVIMDANPTGSSNVDPNIFNTYNDVVLEYPAPVDDNEWEKADEAQERINSRLENIYETDDENIQNLKEMISEHKIKFVTVNATKSLSKVARVTLMKLSKLRNRSESFFEQTFVLNCDIAEMLILEGICFLSKFKRMCPVYICENPKTILNPYQTSRQKGTVFPVVHRSFIYFIHGKDSLIKFRTNPLNYIVSDNILSYQEYPLRIGIIGPPKSGKSDLAANLAKRYGLMCLSKGMAVRYIIEKMHWTKLGTLMATTLESGECLSTDLVIKAVQSALLIDHRTTTHGFILDGFPDCPAEAMELSKIGLYPLVIFDLTTDRDVLMENSQKEIYLDIMKTKPPYSRPFIEYRFMKWKEHHCRIRNYIKDDVQNLYLLDGNESRWQCLQETQNYINEIIPKIYYYLSNVNTTIVPVDVMGISTDTFQRRMSCFKNMCPVCICSNTLKHSGYPVDRKGVVQYNELFYWICADHMKLVLEHPKQYLNAYSVNIPEIPAVVKTVNVSHVYENGICMVTYAQNLPTQTIVSGSNDYAATYRGKTYLFCSAACLGKFMSKPHMYYDIAVFKETRLFPKICLQKLPNIGYLEQYVGNIITDACCALNVLRPKYPGLDIKLSGLLFIALYLKIHNPEIDKSKIPLYSKAFRIYEARSKLIIELGLRLRSMENPFAKYPECCLETRNTNSGTVCKPTSLTSLTSTLSVSRSFI